MLLKLLKGALGRKPPAPPARPVAAAPPQPAAPPKPVEPPAPEARATLPEEAMRKEAALRALIDHGYSRLQHELAPATRQAVEASAACFPAPAVPAALNVFAFHVDMGGAAMKYRDMTVDPSRIDYLAVLRAFVAAVHRWHPGACIYLVTNTGSPLASLAAERVHVVELDAAADQTMYQRVRAMCAYVHSPAFTADTLFLDSDAFLNGPADAWLPGDYDMVVTYRNRLWLMPVNEGVMAARYARPEAVRAFFRRYLATYDVLADDDEVKAFYGDVRRWRGGQLSLNAITRGGYPFSPCRQMNLEGTVVKALPADRYNYSYEATEDGAAVDPRQFTGRAVVHMKGHRKESLEAWLSYAAQGAS